MPMYHYVYLDEGVFLGNPFKRADAEAENATDLRNRLAKKGCKNVTICDYRTKKPLRICPKCQTEYRWIRSRTCAKCGERFIPVVMTKFLRWMLGLGFFVIGLNLFAIYSTWFSLIPVFGMVLCFLPYRSLKGPKANEVPEYELYEDPSTAAEGAKGVMPSGACEACGALAATRMARSVTDVTAALSAGFRPRYGRAVFDAAVMNMVGSSFGFSGLNPPAPLQAIEHEKAIQTFVDSLKTKDGNSEIALCDTCAGEVKAILTRLQKAKQSKQALCVFGGMMAGLIGLTMVFGNIVQRYSDPSKCFNPWLGYPASVLLCSIAVCLFRKSKRLSLQNTSVPPKTAIKCSARTEDVHRFTVSHEGVITDSISNLQWVVGPDLRTTYEGAEEWVRKCGIAGGNWRMPTREELRQLRVQNEASGNMDPVFKTTGRNIWADPQEAGEGYGPRGWCLCFPNGRETLLARDYYDDGTRAFGVRPTLQAPPARSIPPSKPNDITTIVADLMLFVSEQWKSESDPSLRLRREDYKQIFEEMARLPIQKPGALPTKAYEGKAVTAEKVIATKGFYLAQALAQGATLKIEPIEPGLLRIQAGSADFRIERNGQNEFRSCWCDDSDTKA